MTLRFISSMVLFTGTVASPLPTFSSTVSVEDLRSSTGLTTTQSHLGKTFAISLEIEAGVGKIGAWGQSIDQSIDANGWPIGFFDRTYGALADDPIERPEQPPLEIREEIE